MKELKPGDRVQVELAAYFGEAEVLEIGTNRFSDKYTILVKFPDGYIQYISKDSIKQNE